MSPYWIPESVIGAVPIPLCSVLIVTLTGIRSTWCYHIWHCMMKHPHQIAERVHNTQKALGWTTCREAARITRAKWEGSPNADVNVEAALEKWDWEAKEVMHWVRYCIAANDANPDGSVLRLEPGWNSSYPFPTCSHKKSQLHNFSKFARSDEPLRSLWDLADRSTGHCNRTDTRSKRHLDLKQMSFGTHC